MEASQSFSTVKSVMPPSFGTLSEGGLTQQPASKLKDEMETKNVSAFNNGIIKHNTWLEDTREIIIKEEGDSYNKYLCSMFRGYLSRDDKEIIDAIKDEGRKWTQGNTWKQLLIL